jgi:hypothetical protein
MGKEVQAIQTTLQKKLEIKIKMKEMMPSPKL